MAAARVHLGCGNHVVPGWVNVDGSWNALLAKHPTVRSLLVRIGLLPARVATVNFSSDIMVRDLRRPLPFANDSVEAVYASHLLEHLYFYEAMALIGEAFRVLQPGGTLRLVVPDLAAMVREYLGEIQLERHPQITPDMSRADILMHRINTRRMQPPRGPLPYRMYRNATQFDDHKWMYDAESLVRRMESHGFVEVAERKLHDSRIPDIEALEQPGRVENGEGICVEGIKPRATR